MKITDKYKPKIIRVTNRLEYNSHPTNILASVCPYTLVMDVVYFVLTEKSLLFKTEKKVILWI